MRQRGSSGIGQGSEERSGALVHGVTDDVHLDRLARYACTEREGAPRQVVVGAVVRGSFIRGREIDRRRTSGRTGPGYGQLGNHVAAVAFYDRGVGDG